MTDSIDKKSNDKRDKLDVDLDAMLDEAKSSLSPRNEFQDDEDAIDRLLMNAGFDADDELEPPAEDKEIELGLYDELDDFLGFDNFGDTIKESEKALAGAVEPEDVSTIAALSGLRNEEDDLDRLLMNAAMDADDMPLQVTEEDNVNDKDEELDHFSDFSDFNDPNFEFDKPELATSGVSTLVDEENELDNALEDDAAAPAQVVPEVEESDEERDPFSDFNDFNEPAIIPVAEAEEPEPVVEELPTLADEVDDFSFLNDEFDASDMIEDEAVEPSSFDVGESGLEQAAIDLSADDKNAAENLLLDDGFDSGNALEQTAEKLSEPDDNTGLSDEIDDFSFLDDEFNTSDLIEDDEVPAPVQADADSLASAQGQPAAVESDSDEDSSESPDEIDDFSFLDDEFNTSDLIEDDEVPAPVQADADSLASAQEQPAAVEPDSDEDSSEPSDEIDDFSFLDDEFNTSDLIEDDEVPAPVQADTDSLASAQEQPAAVEPDSDEDSPESPDEIDDFSILESEFDASDMIQDDEDLTVDAEASQQQQVAFNDLQDDGLDSLLMDSGFTQDDVPGQEIEKNDAFGDDVDLSEIDEFFQLDEVSDDFSKETGEGVPAETEEASVQDEDDFLLPDFDITADTEISDMGSNSGVKEDDLAGVFGDTSFLDEDDAVQAFAQETPDLKLDDDDTIFESQPKQTADTAVNEIEDINMDPLELEQEEFKKQLEDAESRVKKAKRFTYAALGLGAVALSAAAGLGVMTYSAKSEVSKLTEQVSALEASLAKNSENNPNAEINAVMSSVAQLNQQVYGFVTELQGNAQFPVDLLNNKVPDLVAKQDMVSKALEVLQGKMGIEGKVPLEPLAAPPKIEIKHEPAPAKIEAASQEHVPGKEGAEHEHAPEVKDKTAHEIAPTKDRAKQEAASVKVEPVPEAAPVKVKVQPEAAPAKPVITPKVIVKEEPVKAITKEVAPGKWGVNLVAFKQEWFAKSKAAEFARLGVFAEVIPVYEKGATMYRLRAGGFRSKAEALSNSDRIKKALNLDSVWVSDN